MFIVGIDIAKKSHQGIIIDSEGKPVGKTFKFKNTMEGFDNLLGIIKEVDSDISHFEVGMEATGHYWINLYTRLIDKGFKVHVINPLQSDAIRNLYLRKTKTDSVDSKLIANVIRFGEYTETRLTDDKLLAVRELSRQRFYLVDLNSDLKRKVVVVMDKIFPEYQKTFSDMFGKTSCAILKRCPSAKEVNDIPLDELTSIVQEASRKKFSTNKANEVKAKAKNSFSALIQTEHYSILVKQMVEQIEMNEKQIKDLEKVIAEKFDQLNSKITQIPGIGPVLGAVIVSEIGDINRFSSPKKLVAYAGIDPSIKQSGDFLSSANHMSKRGSPYLRRALWIASFVNLNHNKEIAELYTKKTDGGKSHYRTMGFLCHKLLNIIYVVLKNNVDYVPYYNQEEPEQEKKCS
ncbi:MAG: IS110 family transposase [Treponema sp.]|nr:IS110 family transposase [Spirochaetia bacterium]MDD7460522.1 IS110 family transposase [Spirochaetales bacterium]MDY5812068.1 IS110 family transposase [Treponema sp.]MEE1182440.1 IS110 family transposase [Treponema sp.]